MYSKRLIIRSFVIVSVLIMVATLLIGLRFLLWSQTSTAMASYGQISDRQGWKTDSSDPYQAPLAIAPSNFLPITGVVLAPTNAYSYSFQIFTAPEDINFVLITATATWSDDWHTPLVTETTQSYPNIVEIPYLGGEDCDYIYDYFENNFRKLSLDAENQFDRTTRGIIVGPGKSVAIAGSDCGFDDNFDAHYHIVWRASEQHRIFLPLTIKGQN